MRRPYTPPTTHANRRARAHGLTSPAGREHEHRGEVSRRNRQAVGQLLGQIDRSVETLKRALEQCD